MSAIRIMTRTWACRETLSQERSSRPQARVGISKFVCFGTHGAEIVKMQSVFRTVSRTALPKLGGIRPVSATLRLEGVSH